MNLLKLATLTIATVFTLNVSAQETETAAVDTTKTWTIKGENTFLINQSSFSNWAAGGINSMAGNLIFNYDFNYKKDKWSWDNKVLAAYGQTFQKETDWRKNDDRFSLNSLLGYQAAEKWLYTVFLNFNTQFANGYSYDNDNAGTLISKAFAPAYLSFGPGIAYKESDNFRINLSPAAARFIMVGAKSLRGLYDVDVDKFSRNEFGASLDAYYKLGIMENIALENILKLYSNYLQDPQNVDVDYTANLKMQVNKFISVNAAAQLIYDDNIDVPKSDGTKGPGLQVRQVLGAGVTYKF
ncbi:DUF3078 domain-containing protein [Sphingobacterium sp. DK4209]|uniref:DUF3078 domain-containing protein n=1 Tax=Sphingobacterium zhuxiongii TaxID=2662364 RepID=A0A5Q0QF16_9SPHI|nr:MULTISPECIES: DUF3078 domain-containing protein [unclassified Sphingobacterium]MVZ65277.1 DUF3078 domain-containing protein [Sphingobacterium sp. DK4209]QGA26368.1 DUF3078 domain-containing protein [Sphingobacterium sp. dk4302]